MMQIRLPYGGLFTKIGLFLAVLFAVGTSAQAQGYVLNGSTSATGSNCYTLTPDINGQNGSLWYQNRIDLRYNFDIQYSVYLGTNTGGADGMAFVLQSVGNTVQGSSGSGMGYGGISPSLEVEYDTYPNTDYQAYDPPYDHLCIMKNGDFHHTTGQLVSPVPLTNLSNGSVKDGQYHTSRVTWDVASNTLTVYLDGSVKFVYTSDILNAIFLGQPAVYFGFTASTGGLSNQHAVCISTASTFHQYTIPFDIQVTSTNVSCGGNGADGTATATFSGGTLPYTFDGWTYPGGGVAYTTTISNLAVGTYKADAHDALGVFLSKSISVNSDYQPIPTISASGPTSFCAGGSIILTASAGNSYFWNTGETTQSITVTQSGNYTVSITNAQRSCTATSVATAVTVNPLPIISGPTLVCVGSTVGLTATPIGGIWSLASSGTPGVDQSNGPSGNQAGGNFQWQSFTAGVTGELTSIDISHGNPQGTNGASVITVQVYTGVGVGGTLLGTQTFTYPAQWGSGFVNYAFNGVYLIQGQQYTFLITTPVINYSWLNVNVNGGYPGGNFGPDIPQWDAVFKTYMKPTNASINSNGFVTGLQPGSATVNYTFTSNGCTGIAVFPLAVNAVPAATITVSGATTFCSGGSVILTAPSGSGYTYQWKLNNTDISGATGISYTATAAGNYIVVVSANGCSGTSAPVTITVTPLVINCPEDISTFTNASGNCGAYVTYSAPVVSGNCSGVTVTQISGLPSGSLFPVGTTLNVFKVNDNAGDSSICSFHIMVTDNQPPHVKTRPASVILVNGSASLLTSAVDNGSTDNCNIGSMTLSKTNFDCSNKGPNNVLLTVTDVNGNSASANVVVTVIDASSPVPNTAALPVLTGQCSVSATAPTATDGCGAIITATTNGPVTFSTQGSFTINWTYTAANGKTTSQSQQVIIHDITPPSIPSLPDITGQCSVAATAPTTTDNCAGTVTGTTTDLLTYSQQGNYVIHWSFADGNGNTTTATQNVIVKDITPPVINSLSDISAIATSAAGAVVNYTAPVGTDNCSGASTVLTAGLASGATFPIGVNTVTYTVTDVAGLTASTSFTVTVSGLAPQIVVPSPVSVNTDPGQCGAVVNFAATETTGIPASTITYSVTPGTVFPVGITTVTATATNAVGTSSKTFTVTVTDNEKPNFIVSGTASVPVPYLQTPISSSATVTYNFADPLPLGAVITGIDLSYSAADQGWGLTGGSTRFYVSGTFIGGNVISDHSVHPLSLNYTGGISGYVYGANNTFQFGFEGYPGWQGFLYGGTMTIHYQKTTIPAPVSVKNDAGKCGAVVILTPPVTSDNCGVASITNDAPALFPVGNTTITWKVTDVHGNSNTTTQMVTVTDNEPPKITVPANLTVSTDIGDRVATNVNLGTAVKGDNCGVASVQNDAPTIFPLGVTPVTWTVTDIHGNTITAVQTVTVIDNQPPSISTLTAITKNNDPGICGAIVTYDSPGVTDNVSTNSMVVSAGDADGTVVFNTPLTSNMNSLNFSSSGAYNDIAHGHGVNITVTIELYNPLTNTWTTVQSIQTGTGDYHFGGTAAYFPVISQVSQIRFTASQYVGAALHLYQLGINLNSIPFVQTAGLSSGSLFPVGNTVNAFQAIDAAGNISSQSFTVTVTDAEKPQISGYQGSVQFAMANCSWTGSGGVFTVTDNCSTTLVVSEKDYDSLGNMIYTGQYPVTQGMNALANRTFPLGVNTVQLAVTDAAGNVSDRVVFNVKVVDNTNPSIVTSGSITQSSDPGICGAYIRVPQPVTHDNCSIQSLINSFNSNVSATGNYPVGVTVVTWTVTDASGNKATATQTITVTDNEPPVIIGVPLPVIQTNDAGACGAVVTWNPVLATDNCRVLSFTSDHQSGETFPLGVTTVTFTAKDIHNNTSTASFTITVTDNEAPKVITKPVTVTLINGSATIAPSDINNGSSDNCGAITLSASKTNFTCTDAGVNQVTLTVTDSHGNSSSATAIVTVIGEIPTSAIQVTPSSAVYTGGIPTDIYLGYGSQSVMLTDNVVGITPITYLWTGTGLNCISCQNPLFTPAASGSYTFIGTATNKYGCASTSVVSICVRDIRVTPVANSKVFVCHTDLTTGTSQTLTIAVNSVANQLTQNPQDILGSCGMPLCTVSTGIGVTSIISNPISGNVINNATKESTIAASEGVLSITVSPNPSATVFTLKIHTQKKIPVHVRLIDESGRVVEGRDNAPVETSFTMGAKLITGMYFAEILQGKERVVVKLIKQNR